MYTFTITGLAFILHFTHISVVYQTTLYSSIMYTFSFTHLSVVLQSTCTLDIIYSIPLSVKFYFLHLILLTFRLYFRLHYIAVYCIPLPVKVYLSHLILLTFRLYFKLHYIAVYCLPLPVKVYSLCYSPFGCTSGYTILFIYQMDSRVTYQNISSELTRKPWRVMSPDAEGVI